MIKFVSKAAFILSLAALSTYANARGVPTEIWGIKLGSNVSELERANKTGAYRVTSVVAPSPVNDLDLYTVKHDEAGKISGISAYRYNMLAADCRRSMLEFVSSYSKLYKITFELTKRQSGSDYYVAQYKKRVMAIDCRNNETRLWVALANARNRSKEK